MAPEQVRKMEQAAHDAEEHLRNPFMPGKPHLGVLGPQPDTSPTQGEDAGVDVESEDGSPDSDSMDPTVDTEWRFVPNKAVCATTVTPAVDEPLKSHVQFAIRLEEGCEKDLADHNVTHGRHDIGKLSREEILKALAFYDVHLEVLGPGSEPVIQVHRRIDDEVKPVVPDVDVRDEGDVQRVRIRIRDASRPFVVFKDKVPGTYVQSYDIIIEQIVERLHDGRLQVTLTLLNQSPWSPMSRLPELIRQEDGTYLSPAESLEKFFKGNVPPAYQPKIWKVQQWSSNASGNNFGYLMDVSLAFEMSSLTHPYTERDAGQTINVINAAEPAQLDGKYEGRLLFRDSAVFAEEIPHMTPGTDAAVTLKNLEIHPVISKVFAEDKGFGKFHLFQEHGMDAITRAVRNAEWDGVIISARTASGKTETFAVPIVDYCLTHTASHGTKALVFYPTKALANDQANRFIEILFHLNARLVAEGKPALSVGILHGDVSMTVSDDPEDETDLPLACPHSSCPGRLRGTGDYQVTCDECGTQLDFVHITSRRSIYSRPPDILITNPDTLTWDLLARPWHHSVLGRPTFVCDTCLATSIAVGTKRICGERGCKGKVRLIEPSLPGIVVFDEVHLVKGAFGINTSMFLSRLLSVLKKYAREYHDSENHRVTLVGSTATISNARPFARDFFHLPDERIRIVPQDEDERRSFYQEAHEEKGVRRYHLACIPYAYQGDSTVARVVQYLQARRLKGAPPAILRPDGSMPNLRETEDDPFQVLTFVNNIRTSNNLIASSQRGFAAERLDVKVDGHTTDFDRKQRGQTERSFNRQETHVLFATSTLEVGVDFRQIDVVVPYGMPYSFNDYLQRIGRCGRSRDGLVITVCQNWKPIDHYYFSNLRQQLRDPARAMEPVPIARENIEALKRHARCAVLDYIASHARSPTWLDDVRKLPVGMGGVPLDELIGYVLATLDPPKACRDEIKEAVERFYNELDENRKGRLTAVQVFQWFHEELNEIHQLTNMRSTDPQVLVEVIY